MKKFLLSLSLVLVAGYASAQCAAGFTWSQIQPNVIQFNNTSTVPFPNATWYIWDFGDGNYNSFTTSGTHQYNVPGTYVACLQAVDSLNMVFCTYCDTITVTGSVICNMWSNISQTPASSISSSDGSATVMPYNGTAPYAYAWSDGQTTQTATGLAAGVYSVCVTDINGCTVCDTITVQVNFANACNIGFNNYPQNNGFVYFSAIVTGANSSYTITWDFGDATTGSGANVQHQYTQNGSYYVCAYLTDSLSGCSDMQCAWVGVVISNAACNAGFYVQLDSANSNQACIYNTSTGGPGMTYQWFWGDQTPVDTGAYPSHVYQTSGGYNLCLVVVDQANQCTDTACAYLTVPRLTQQAAQAPFYVNVVPPLPMGIQDAESVSWTLYPNPVNDVLSINGPYGANTGYRITDISGRVVMSGVLSNNSVAVDGLSNGVYFFSLITDNGITQAQRFIKQ